MSACWVQPGSQTNARASMVGLLQERKLHVSLGTLTSWVLMQKPFRGHAVGLRYTCHHFDLTLEWPCLPSGYMVDWLC